MLFETDAKDAGELRKAVVLYNATCPPRLRSDAKWRLHIDTGLWSVTIGILCYEGLTFGEAKELVVDSINIQMLLDRWKDKEDL